MCRINQWVKASKGNTHEVFRSLFSKVRLLQIQKIENSEERWEAGQILLLIGQVAWTDGQSLSTNSVSLALLLVDLPDLASCLHLIFFPGILLNLRLGYIDHISVLVVFWGDSFYPKNNGKSKEYFYFCDSKMCSSEMCSRVILQMLW